MKTKVIIISLFVGATSAIAYAISKKRENMHNDFVHSPASAGGSFYFSQ